MRPRATTDAIGEFTGILASDRARIEALELVAHRHRYALDPTAWTPVVFLGAWGNAVGTQAVEYRIVGDVVSIRGCATGGAAGSAIFNLPVGFRPPALLSFATNGNNAFGAFTVAAGGNVTNAVGAAVNVWLTCSFSITV